MLVHCEPHVEQDFCRHARVAQATDDIQREAEHAKRGIPEDDPAERGEVTSEERFVNEVFGEIRNGETGCGAEETDGDDQEQIPPYHAGST